MADARVTQPSFASGEISDELWGRQDLAKYQVGARQLQNMFVHASGGVSNRGGLRFATEVKDSTKAVRLQRFEAAADDAYLLEVGPEYIRPIYRGGYVMDGPDPVEIPTTWTEAMLPDIYMEQSNDIATITNVATVPRELRRNTPTDWSLNVISFQPSNFAPAGLTVTSTEGFTDYPDDKLEQVYTYKVSSVNAAGEESLPSAAVDADGSLVLGYDKNFNTATWSAVAGAVEYKIYKEENGLFGFIGRTPELTFKDDNFGPDFSQGPQEGRNPFPNTSGMRPAISTFLQQRRVFAHTLNNPQGVWMTQSGNYNNMNVSTPTKDDDAIEFTLAARKKQDIYHMVPLKKGMIMFTRSGEWTVTGRDGDVITPSSILPEPQSEYGCSQYLKPIIAGQQILFVPRASRKVLEMEYSLEIDSYKAASLTLLSSHLFKGRTIVNWSLANEPYGIIWCVMSDGELLSLTYLKEHDVFGWGHHITKGKFLDVCTVPEAEGYDMPYFLVQRRIQGVQKKYIEYMPPRDFTDVRDCFFVDSGLSYDAPLVVTGITPGDFTQVLCPAHGFVEGDKIEIANMRYLDADGEVQETLDGVYLVAAAVLPNAFVIHDLDGNTINTNSLAGLYLDVPGEARKAVSTVSGLNHLRGRRVVALCDGNVIENLTVSLSGVINLPRQFSRIHIGLSYEALLYTLDIINPAADANGVKKATARAFVRVDKSRGFFIGPDPENMVEDEPRDYEDYGEPARLKSEKVETELWADWGEENTLAVRQPYPLPLTVLGVTTELAYGG